MNLDIHHSKVFSSVPLRRINVFNYSGLNDKLDKNKTAVFIQNCILIYITFKTHRLKINEVVSIYKTH